VTAAYTTHARYTRPQRDVDDVCIEVSMKLHPEFHRVTGYCHHSVENFWGERDVFGNMKKEKEKSRERRRN